MERLDSLLRDAFPNATDLRVVDRTGTGDHFHVLVRDASFYGLSLVEQHKLVYAALDGPLQDGTIHELRITTKGTEKGH
jgi:stress-induced morphogen